MTSRAGAPGRRPTGGVAVDPQTLRMRQGLLVGVGLLVVILLALGVRGCLSSAESAACAATPTTYAR